MSKGGRRRRINNEDDALHHSNHYRNTNSSRHDSSRGGGREGRSSYSPKSHHDRGTATRDSTSIGATGSTKYDYEGRGLTEGGYGVAPGVSIGLTTIAGTLTTAALGIGGGGYDSNYHHQQQLNHHHEVVLNRRYYRDSRSRSRNRKRQDCNDDNDRRRNDHHTRRYRRHDDDDNDCRGSRRYNHHDGNDDDSYEYEKRKRRRKRSDRSSSSNSCGSDRSSYYSGTTLTPGRRRFKQRSSRYKHRSRSKSESWTRDRKRSNSRDRERDNRNKERRGGDDGINSSRHENKRYNRRSSRSRGRSYSSISKRSRSNDNKKPSTNREREKESTSNNHKVSDKDKERDVDRDYIDTHHHHRRSDDRRRRHRKEKESNSRGRSSRRSRDSHEPGGEGDGDRQLIRGDNGGLNNYGIVSDDDIHANNNKLSINNSNIKISRKLATIDAKTGHEDTTSATDATTVTNTNRLKKSKDATPADTLNATTASIATKGSNKEQQQQERSKRHKKNRNKRDRKRSSKDDRHTRISTKDRSNNHHRHHAHHRHSSRRRRDRSSGGTITTIKSRRRRSDHKASYDTATNKSISSRDIDDSYGHFEGGPDTVIDNRYKIVKDVGMGTFGRVVQAIDLQAREQRRLNSSSGRRGNDDDHRHSNHHRYHSKILQSSDGGGARSTSGCKSRFRNEEVVAIKIVRSVKRYHQSALIEADILNDVNNRGGKGNSHFVVMLRQFEFDGHCCLVFEKLGRSLYDFLKKNDYKPFPLYCVKDFARQLLEALEFIHSFDLIHTDLKPENILLTSNKEKTYKGQQLPASTSIKLIDFGGATYDNEKKSTIINTRQYRAPEVILGLGWSSPSDLWSAGCIISELYLGELLFATHDNSEHLALIEKIIGRFPRDMLIRSKEFGSTVFDTFGFHTMDLPSESKAHVRSRLSLDSIVSESDKESGLVGLLKSLLMVDPAVRATAGNALKAPFLDTSSRS